jgi:UDP:flavonoid glycosyltransferase YjiC (YdhE family)
MPLPQNARVEFSVPHAEVLKRVCLLVSHAGHGVVLRALYDGVPMVLVSWGRDQPGVAARVEA